MKVIDHLPPKDPKYADGRVVLDVAPFGVKKGSHVGLDAHTWWGVMDVEGHTLALKAWSGSDGWWGKDGKLPDVGSELRVIENSERIIDKLAFTWTQHEYAAWSGTRGGSDVGGADYSARVKEMRLWEMVGPNNEIWKWTAKYSLGGVAVRARGYARTMDAGKEAAEDACNRIHAGFRS